MVRKANHIFKELREKNKAPYFLANNKVVYIDESDYPCVSGVYNFFRMELVRVPVVTLYEGNLILGINIIEDNVIMRSAEGIVSSSDEFMEDIDEWIK